jgi:hypothetical protein
VRRARCRRGIAAGALVIALVGAFGGAAGADDQTTADSLVITPADVAKLAVSGGFPAPAAGGQASSTVSPNVAFATFADCVGLPPAERSAVASASGPVLTSKSGHIRIRSLAGIMPSSEIAQADRRIVQSSSYPRCLAQNALDVGKSSGVASVKARRIPFKRYGDYSTAVLETQRFSSGRPAANNAVFVIMMRGRAEIITQTVTDGTTPVDRRTIEEIVGPVAKRLRAADV